MKQHLKDQIEYILENFDFAKMQKVMYCLGWTWRDDASPPSTARLQSKAWDMLHDVARHEQKATHAMSGGFLAQKIDGYRLSLFFAVEDVDGTDIVGDEGP